MMRIDEDYEQFVSVFFKLSGIHLQAYKETQMKRRLTALRDKRHFSSFSSYANAMANDPLLLTECVDRVTINVSSFFRNRTRWETLRTEILPRLATKKSGLNIWSSACSTGEEPYSLAMLIKEANIPLQNKTILATDIDSAILEKARLGRFRQDAFKEMNSQFQHAYFRKQGDDFAIIEDVKKLVNFKRLNLLADEYPTRCDLIICRNVLIYFTEEAKQTIFKKFSESLVHGGVLFVGSTEQIFDPQQYGLQAIKPFFYEKVT
ncbi:protein-glutamate O-methyltransferase CheR [Bacillus sp. FSL K6-0047]